MQLKELLHNYFPVDAAVNCEVTGLAQDSRQVKSGDLFFAYPGVKTDGRQYIADAIQRGASAILVETTDDQPLSAFTSTLPSALSANIIGVTKLAAHMGAIAARFYGNPSQHLKVVGITGTNGKTTCSHLVAQALEQAGHASSIIGTLGYGLMGQLQPGGLTTPDAVELQRLLAGFHAQGAKYVSMEVSSHRLAQNRISGLAVAIAVFTNLTRDHLDYHGDMQHYAAAKRSLFDQPGLQYAILNADDAYGQQWLRELNDKLPVFAYSLEQPKAALADIPHTYVHHATFSSAGITASVHTPWGEGVLHSPYLVGRFNLSNLLVVLTVLGILGIPLQKALTYISKLRSVSGRMETVGGADKPLIVIDYAHTPDALQQVLRVLREQTTGRLWCVFGCGGDRDAGKRPLMGEIAEHYADNLVITDDNPRTEDPRQIITEILQGLREPAKAVVEHDRRRAIAHAVGCAQAGDVVLIAGKGHETYQIIGSDKQPFSDSLEVKLILSE